MEELDETEVDDTLPSGCRTAQLMVHGGFSTWNLISLAAFFATPADDSMRKPSQPAHKFGLCVSLCAGVLSLQACNIAPYQPVSPQSIAFPGPGTVETQLPERTSNYQPNVGSEIVIRAISLLGAPYKWGGSGPAAFDCSGLVQFIHNELGIDVPRTAEEQYRAATRVDVEELEPGDLLFFKIRGRKISHVAIYAGSGRFVHAPQTGRPIEIRTLDDGYYRPRLAAAGRLF
jgi:murein DD-endopeptidase